MLLSIESAADLRGYLAASLLTMRFEDESILKLHEFQNVNSTISIPYAARSIE